MHWNAPSNIDKFDLEHYTIEAVPLSSKVGKGYTLNVTGSELEYPFGLIINSSSQPRLNNLTVSAISKCSQQGPKASATIAVTQLTLSQNNPVNASTENFNFTTTELPLDSRPNGIIISLRVL